MLRQAVVFCAVLSVALGALAIAKLEQKPEKFKDVEGCYISELDMVIPFSQSKPSNKSCMEYRCSETYVTYVTCGVAVAMPPCKVVRYLEKPYPECCPKIECSSTEGNTEEKNEEKTEENTEEKAEEKAEE